tara:strand:+ start:593 stop:784 length:192 start_codon:yes stop_codon:yes gene_type:complete
MIIQPCAKTKAQYNLVITAASVPKESIFASRKNLKRTKKKKIERWKQDLRRIGNELVVVVLFV